MRRLTLIAIVVFSSAALVAACSSDDDAGTAQDTAASASGDQGGATGDAGDSPDGATTPDPGGGPGPGPADVGGGPGPDTTPPTDAGASTDAAVEGVCGDGVCAPDEGAVDCPQDCCQSPDGTAGCGDGFCHADPGCGESADTCPDDCGGASTVTWTADVQPILQNRCGPCHAGGRSGGHNGATSYADTQADSYYCQGKKKGDCFVVRVLDGSMPQGARCTGDPATDAGNDRCLTQAEIDVLQAWADGGLPE